MSTSIDRSPNEPPLVSVIIPAYNAEAYIGRAIESTLEQTLSNIEVVVVDDASSDSTLEIINNYAERDARVKAIANPTNLGAACARNRAIDASSGEWITPLDADDWFSPSRLSSLLESVQDSSTANAPIDMIADDFYFVDHVNLEPQGTFVERNKAIYQQPIEITASFFVTESNKEWGNTVGPGYLKPLIRRSLLEKHGIRYRESVRVGQDFFLYLDCLIAGARFWFHPEPHYFYLVRPGSLSRRSDESKLERFRHYQRELSATLQNEQLNSDPELKSALANKLNICNRKLQYRIVIDSLRRKRYLQASIQAVQNPLFFVHLFQTLFLQKLRKAFN